MELGFRGMGALSGIAAGLMLVACVPLFTAGLFQSLNLTFRFDAALPAGEATLVHSAVFPEQVKVKKSFVQIAGRFQSDDELPGNVTVEAEVTDLDSGKVSQRISIKLKVGDDGSFRGSTKIKKNVGAGEIMSITLEPSGADLALGTEVTVCVDLAKSKKALGSLPECVSAGDAPGDGNGGGAAGESFASLQNDFFTPTCARGGCHSQASASGGLVLAASQAFDNLVNTPSTQTNLNRVSPGDSENSYLVRKLRGDAGISGSRMPAGGPFLSDAQIQRFVSWIDAGAPNN